MMCPRALRKWDDEECLVEKKKILLSLFYISFCYITYSNEPRGCRSTALNRRGVWLSVGWHHDRHQRVAEFFCYYYFIAHVVCYGTTLYLPLIRRIAPHIPLKITTHSFNLSFFFTYFGVARWGRAKKGRM